MKHALWIIAGLSLLILLLLPLGRREDLPASVGPPWQIERLADGSTRVFGLSPGSSSFHDALERFGPQVEVALFQSPRGELTAEAYFPSVRPAGIAGRLILTIDLDPAMLGMLRDRSPRQELLGTGNIRYTLHGDDVPRIQAARIRGMTFVPAIQLDESLVESRFGPAPERFSSAENTVHWLYPERGLDVTINRQAKEALQYVHPDDFAWIRAGLARERDSLSSTRP